MWIKMWVERLNEWIPEWIAKGLDCAPEYEPDKWNTDKTVRETNNCYNYGCNSMSTTGKQAQPGGSRGASITASGIHAGVKADGLRQIDYEGGEKCGCKECCHIVALAVVGGRYREDVPSHLSPELQAIDPVGDYHFLRKDSNGRWSHKKGDGGFATGADDPPRDKNGFITGPAKLITVSRDCRSHTTSKRRLWE